MEKKRIIILLSTYNGETFIRQQLDSILNQAGVAPYLLIRDDGSEDSTCKILREYAELHPNIKIYEEDNIGSTQSFMKLLAYANETYHDVDYFAFSDQDDIWLKHKLAHAIDVLEQKKENEPTPQLYCSNLRIVDSNLSFIRYMHKEQEAERDKARSLVESFATGCTMVFNKEALRLACIAPSHEVILHDLLLFHICMFMGRVTYDSTALILYRQHQRNQIGANATVSNIARNKLKSIKTLRQQHFREEEAHLIHKHYSFLLSEEDETLLRVLREYRHSFLIKLKWLLGDGKPYCDIKMSSCIANFILKVRILINHV